MNFFTLVCLCLLPYMVFTVSYSKLLEDSVYLERKVKYAYCVPDWNWNYHICWLSLES